MQKPSIPENESARLKALFDYEVLDTQSEQVFDEITQLASEICDTPIALISLVDANRQWFKSKHGIDASETAREIAFCAHAINQTDILEIRDTHLDNRFKDNPLVQNEPKIRFYAGAPLITSEGLAIGTICAIDSKPAKLNQHQRKAMQILSREVISQLELRIKLRQLEKANDRKTEFLSSLSHELHTPLHAIVNLSQLMLNNKHVVLPEVYYTYLKHLDFSGRRLLKLVDTVLDANKLESGQFELNEKTINVNDYFTYIKSAIEQLASNKAIKVDFTLSSNLVANIKIDDARLSQIILNISENAIKFSPSLETIIVNVVLKQNSLTIAIKDNGIGMDEKDIPLLFDKYQRAANRNTTEGTGLGLMITKSIVELMQGDIKVSSKLNKGSLIKVTIPLTTSNALATSSSSLHEKHGSTLKVLVVEDNYINQEIAATAFASIGIRIDIAKSGQEAVEMALKNNYSTIFMDIHLPDFDGFEASSRIVKHKPNQKIVALTADIFANQDPRNQSALIHSIVPKPFQTEDLLNALEIAS